MRPITFLVLALALSLPQGLAALSCTWTGAAFDGSWSTAGNWDCGTVPLAGDDVFFTGVPLTDCNIDANVLVSSFAMDGSFTGIVTLMGGLNLATGAFTQNAGTLNLSAGTFVAAGPATLGGGTFTAPASVAQFDGGFSGSGGLFFANNGTLRFGGGGFSSVNPGPIQMHHVEFNASGGNLDLNGNWLVSGDIQWNSSFTNAGTSNFMLNGPSQLISGTPQFNNLEHSGPFPATLSLDADISVFGTLNLQGQPGQLLTLNSSVSGVQRNFTHGGISTFSYLQVQDISLSPSATASNSVDLGNNIGWTFGAPTPSSTITPTRTATRTITLTRTPSSTRTPTPTQSPTAAPACGDQTAFGFLTATAGMGGGSGSVLASRYMLSQAALVVGLKAHINFGTGNLRLAIYKDNGGAPGDLIVETPPAAFGAGWNRIPVPGGPTLLPGSYWLALQTTGSPVISGATGPIGIGYSTAQGFSNFPSPAPAGSSTVYHWAIQAEICPSLAVIPGPFASVTQRVEGTANNGTLLLYSLDYDFFNAIGNGLRLQLPACMTVVEAMPSPFDGSGATIGAGQVEWVAPDAGAPSFQAKGSVWALVSLAGCSGTLCSQSEQSSVSAGGTWVPGNQVCLPVGGPNLSLSKQQLDATFNPLTQAANAGIVRYVLNYSISGSGLRCFDSFNTYTPGTYTASALFSGSWVQDAASTGVDTWQILNETGNDQVLRYARSPAGLYRNLYRNCPAATMNGEDFCGGLVTADLRIDGLSAGADAALVVRSNYLTGAANRGYKVILSSDNAPGYLAFERLTGTAAAWPAVYNGLVPQLQTWYSVKVLEEPAGSFRIKAWKRGEAEPSSWQISYTDANMVVGGLACGSNGDGQVWRAGVGGQDAVASWDNLRISLTGAVTGARIWDSVPVGIDYSSASPAPNGSVPAGGGANEGMLRWDFSGSNFGALGGVLSEGQGSFTWSGTVDCSETGGPALNQAHLAGDAPALQVSSNTQSLDLACGFTATPTSSASPSVTRSPTATQTATPVPLAPVFGHTSYGGGSYHSLNAPGLKTSARFAQRGTKNLDQFGVLIFNLNGSPPPYRYSLYPDNGSGDPAAVPLRTLTSAVTAGWNSFNVSPVALVDGAIYHVVVEPDTTPPDALNYIDVLFQFAAPAWTLDQVYDPILRGGTGSGSAWSFGGGGPVLLLHYDDSSLDGGSFRTTNATGAYGLNHAGQSFRAPAGGAWVSSLGVRMQRQGSPADALYYRIFNVTQGSSVATGTFSTPAAAPFGLAWMDAALPSPIYLNDSDLYRLEFSSPASVIANGYVLETGFTGGGPTSLHDYTFGGSVQTLANSTDGGGSFAPDGGQDLYFRFNQGLVPAPTVTPTRTATPCMLVVSGLTTLTTGSYSYCGVQVLAGGQLNIDGAVTLNISGDLVVDSSGSINGLGFGWPANGIQSNGNGLGAGGMGNGAGGAGGAGHGAAGGNGSGYVNGGISYGSAAAPSQMGSSGGSGNIGLGGAGGAALVVNATGTVLIDGLVRVNGAPGGNGGSANLSSGGGGAGGSLHITADIVSGNGTIEARGGNGGSSLCGTASCWGGGGGAGGRVNLCAGTNDSFIGVVDVVGGAPGASGPALPQMGGVGSFLRCAAPGFSPTPSASPSWTPTATATASPTWTATVTASQTATPTATPTDSPTASPTQSWSATDSPTRTVTVTASQTATPTATPTDSPTPSPTQSWSATDSPTRTVTVTASQTATPTATPSASPSSSATPTGTPTASPSATPSPSPSASPSFTAVPAATWFSCNWPWRKALTVQGSQISGTHPDFPLYVELVDPQLQARARSDGFDLLFTDHDGATQLPHEIESWDPGTGTLKAWVKVPVLDHGVDRKLYLYYGHAASADQQNATAVWSNGFAGVWHLDAGGADASGMGRDGVNNGAVPIAGQLAGAYDFNAAHFDTGTWNPSGAGLTLEGWVWFDNILGSDGRVISKAVNDQDEDHVFMLSNLSDKARMRIKTGGNDSVGTAVLVGTQTLSNNRWYHLAATFDGGELRLYVDGALDATLAHPSPGALRGNSWPVWIGANPLGLSTDHNGRLDEVRVAGVARSAGWLATQFANQNAPGSFITAGSEELSGCATATPTVTETPSPTLSWSATASPTSSATATASPTATPSRTASETATGTATPSRTASETGTATATPSRTASETATSTATPSRTASETATATATSSRTASETPTATPTPSRTASETATGTATASRTASETATSTATPSRTASETQTLTATPSRTASETASSTRTATLSASPSSTGTGTMTGSPTRTATASATPSASPTSSRTASPTFTPVASSTFTPSATPSQTPLPTATPTFYGSPTPSFTITPTFSITDTPLPTSTPEAPAVLSKNVWRPGLGTPLHIGIKSPSGGKVTVRVYNLAGEKVRAPFEADVPAQVTVDAVWDGKNEQGEPCSAGVYMVSVQGAGISRVLKVVLMK